MNSFQEAIQAVLNADADHLGNKVKDYLSEDNIYSLETHTAFLDDLPPEQYLPTAEKLIELIIQYQDFSNENFSYTVQEASKKIKNAKDTYKLLKGDPIKKEKTPSIKIKNDIKALERAKQVLLENFNAPKSADKIVLFNPPNGLRETFSFLDSMIDDLKKKEFKIAKKSNYYEYTRLSKTPLKQYLDKLAKTYNLKVSDHAKTFIDFIIQPIT